MNDIFYLFGIVLIIKNIRNLFILFKRRNDIDDIPDDIMGMADMGMEKAKSIFKLTPKKILSLFCVLWVLTGYYMTNDNKLFTYLLIVNIGSYIILLIIAIGLILNLTKSVSEVNKGTLLSYRLYHNIVKHFINFLLVTMIVYNHFFTF